MALNSILDFFVSSAYAAGPSGAPQQAGGGFNMLILMAIFIGAMYFMILRPQSKRAKEQRDLISSLAKGDEVVTIGGLAGRINKLTDAYVVLGISDNVEIVFQKNAIATVLPKGTLKSI
jgi:preprotein translocase subunit YajC